MRQERPLMGAEGARDRVMNANLETLRQKDCLSNNLWRDLGKATEGVSLYILYIEQKTISQVKGQRG